MCGFCGFVGDPAGINRAAMLHSLSHRGPDDSGTFEASMPDGMVWLGSRRLAILDLTVTGHQPMSTSDGHLTVAYNGELYNFGEVRRTLERNGHQFRGTSDTEVLLYALREWGANALSRLRGMFALCVWDQRERCLWLARDRVGEKPLYYIIQPGRILFASEVRSLLASGAVPRRMDPDGLDSYLTFGSVADPFTLVQGIRSLEAGSWARFSVGEFRTQRYWSLSDVPELEDDECSREEVVQEAGRLLRNSCKSSMAADVPVGVLLSGGIDSSSLVTILTELGFVNLQTFSVVFHGLDVDHSEAGWSSLVAQEFETDHHEVVVEGEDVVQWVGEAVAAMDQPSYDGVNVYIVSKAIRSAGLKVAISGQGSDELFLGYRQRHLFPSLLKLTSSRARITTRPLAAGAALMPFMHDTRYEKVLQLGIGGDPQAVAYLVENSIFSHKGVERLRGERRPSPARFVHDQGGTSPLNKLSRLQLTHYLRSVLLRDGDQMSMANSLELRQPFLDHRLVEAMASVPGQLKTSPRSVPKPLLVEAVGPRLPRQVVNRPKQGFTLPFGRWLQEGLSVASLSETELGLERTAMEAVHRRFCRGQHWSRYWTLQVLAAWADRERISPC
jgi:asparagine synthase (glutamine-hydrolysing)